MFFIFDTEIEFVCATFKKYRVRANVYSDCGEILSFDVGINSIFGDNTEGKQLLEILPRPLEKHTLYKAETRFKLNYLCLSVSEDEDTVLLIGPFLSEPPSESFVWEVGEKNSVSPKYMSHLLEYYGSLAVIEDGNPLFMMVDTLCERIWNSPSFSISEIAESDGERGFSSLPIMDARIDGTEELRVSMKALEQRYEFENEMILAVSQGQIHKEKQLLSAFSDNAFEKRLTDRLRNAKNYSIIMNTLLRKAAERGGVHPFYIDRLSSDFAAKIERMNYLSENSELMREMFCAYCRLVRKHSTGRYSLLVQKTIIAIESELSAPLSLSYLANMQNVSTGYLSTIFKKETGKTLSEFIIEKRIEYAKHLLETTKLQVQSVALHSGILDVQYFSKLFKKHTGATPKEYRDSMK